MARCKMWSGSSCGTAPLQKASRIKAAGRRSTETSRFQRQSKHAHMFVIPVWQNPPVAKLPRASCLVSGSAICHSSLGHSHMNRRRFVQSAACAGMLSQTAAPLGAQESSRKIRLYRLDFFHYRQGDQATRLNQLFSSQTALLAKHCRSLGMFNGVLAPHVQTLMVLSGFPSFDDMVAAGRAVESDSGFQKAWEEFERGAEPPYDSAERSLLMATDFSPEVAPLAEKPKAPRYFEMRVYHAPTQRQLRMVHERFAGPEIKIFHRVGVHPILYADTVFGNEMPNLT